MSQRSPEKVVPRHATDVGAGWRGEPEQTALFEPPRPSWRWFIRELLRGDYKALGVRLFGGDVEQARIALTKVLEAKNGRRFDVDWLDHLAEDPERAQRLVHFICDRYGFERPNRIPDAEATREELEATKQALTQATEMLGTVAASLKRMEERGR